MDVLLIERQRSLSHLAPALSERNPRTGIIWVRRGRRHCVVAGRPILSDIDRQQAIIDLAAGWLRRARGLPRGLCFYPHAAQLRRVAAIRAQWSLALSRS